MTEKLKRTYLCRCCLSSECYKDINNQYYCDGRIENYSNMLLDVFNINISNNETVRNFICEVCIIKLRDAGAFKKQILHSEIMLLDRLKLLDQEILLDKESIKSENSVCDDFDNIHDNSGDECVDDSFRSSCDITEKSEGQLINSIIEPKNECENNFEGDIKSNIIEKDSSVNTSKKKTTVVKKKRKRKVKINPEKNTNDLLTEAQRDQKENTVNLISYSNMCPFVPHRTKFGCYKCKQQFLYIKELKEHFQSHSDDDYIVYRVRRLRGLSSVNVDISNLTCKLCSKDNIENLQDLLLHLTNAHNIEFEGMEHFLIPYKLEDGLKCVVCGQIFNKFLTLSIHMNRHSSNNVCEVCGTSFINRSNLHLHIQTLHKEKKCTMCDMVFISNSVRTRHMRTIHKIGQYRRYCLLCNKTFKYNHMLVKHNISEHGEASQKCTCPDCGKIFLSPINLKTHIRGVHIKERNYPCGLCDKSFFTKFDRKRHENTHEDIKAFSCDFCEAKFKTKDALRRHLKRLHNYLNDREKT